MPPQSPPALLTPAEAAAVLRVTTRTLRNWVLEGRLESVPLPGGHFRYRRADIERLSGTEVVS